MKLKELLDIMIEVRNKINVPEPRFCGGMPRDRFMGKLENVSDLDLTNGNKTIGYLSEEFYNKLKKDYNVTYKVMEDGHSSIYVGELKLDFSSNFVVNGIDKFLFQAGIKNPTDMQKELYSRDFTCNALLLSIDLEKLYDPTKMGCDDIGKKILKTCLDPSITLTSSKNRVIRCVYLACKLDFNVDDKIIKFVAKNPTTVKICSQKALIDKLNSAFEYDADKASNLLSKMNLWNEIPITENVRPYYLKRVKNV